MTVGNVVQLGSGVKLDLRGSAGYSAYEGDAFRVLNARLTPSMSMWHGSFQPMIFTDLPMNGGTLRPYLQGTIKGIAGYDNALKIQLIDGSFTDTARFRQSSVYWGSEVGLNYGINSWTFGGALYTEQSMSEQTYGAKIGASYKFGK